MATSHTISAKGQFTLKRELLQHLGIKPGERVVFEKLPNGELRVRADRPKNSIDSFFHILDGKVTMDKPLSIGEMNDIAASGWSGQFSNISNI